MESLRPTRLGASVALAALLAGAASGAQPRTNPPPAAPQGGTAAPPAAGTAITRRLTAVTTVDLGGSTAVPPPAPGATEVGSTGAVAAERNLATQLRGNAGPAPGEISDTTPIGPADVARLIRAREAQLRPCYDRARATRPALAGRVELRFTIGRGGEVTQASVTGLPEAPEVSACMTEQLRNAHFPPPSTGTLPFVYPMTLSPPAPARPARRPAARPAARPTPSR